MIAGRIFDRLVTRYGRNSVFRDIDSIPPGVDFREHISRILDQSDVVLAIVGPRWMGPRGGQSRLGNEADPVRVEIETALRKGLPLIPVLVLRAGMPRVEQLPDGLKEFAFRNAVQVDAGQDFDVHLSRLINAMDHILGQAAKSAPQPQRNAYSQDEESRPGFDASVSQAGRSPTVAGRVRLTPRQRTLMLVGLAALTIFGLVGFDIWYFGFGKSSMRLASPEVISAMNTSSRQPRQPNEEAADKARQQTEIAQQEERNYTSAHGDLASLRTYLSTCKVCAFGPAARDEVARLEAAEQEERSYSSAHGNLASLRTYLTSCKVCASGAAARDEVARLEAAEQEERAYSSARGNLASLRTYVSTCKVCAFETTARTEIGRLEATEQEERAYSSARGNLASLRTYVNTCKICAFDVAARAEIGKLEATEQEEGIYSSAQGNIAALRSYVNSCKICAFETAARAEISRLEATEPKRRASSAVLCGRSVDYVVDGTGVSEPYRSFLGVWTGASWNSRICGGLIVERAQSDGTAQISYVYGPNGPTANFPWDIQHQRAVIQKGQLSFQDKDGGNFVFMLTDGNTFFGRFTSALGVRLSAVLRRDPASVP